MYAQGTRPRPGKPDSPLSASKELHFMPAFHQDKKKKGSRPGEMDKFKYLLARVHLAWASMHPTCAGYFMLDHLPMRSHTSKRQVALEEMVHLQNVCFMPTPRFGSLA